MKSLFFVLALVAAASCKVSYDGYQIWRISFEDKSQLSHLQNVIKEFDLDIFSSRKGSVDVNVAPKLIPVLGIHLFKRKLQWETITSDLGVLIRAEEERLAVKPAAFSLTDYNTFEDIEAYLTSVSETSDYATLQTLGQSVEGRDIWQLAISVGGDGSKPVVWFDFTIHAREWISAAVGLYGIDYLINGYGTDQDATSLLDAYDVLIIPVVNPDGYSFTWSDDRLWRKNRNHYDDNLCYGIDLNRNFDDHFGGEGTSDSPCSETYRGPSAASEPETQAIQDGILNFIDTKGLNILFSTHSYSELWMYPYGWTTELPPDDADLGRIAGIGVNALDAVHGTLFDYGPVSTTIYPAASTTIDYSYSQGVVYSYTLELRDTGEYGFELPADQITPSGEETWAGFIAAILAI